MAGMTTALLFMESESTKLVGRTIAKLDELTEEEFAELSFEPVEE